MTQLLPNTAAVLGAYANAITPGRKTTVIFDRSETVVVESGWGGTRSNSQIAPVATRDKGADTNFTKDMYLWSSGCYTLRPLQMDISKIREYALDPTTNQQYIYQTTGSPLPALTVTAIDLIQYSTWKEPIGVGITSTPGRNANGDYFYRKRVAADGSWSQTISAPATITALQTAIEASRGGVQLTQPLDVIFAANANQPADQGFCLRWAVPGNSSDSFDVIGAFTFGQYALVIGGGGDAYLWENSRTSTGEDPEWRNVMTFRYCNPSRVSGFSHKILIFPCLGPHGEKIIHFQGTELENNEPGSDTTTATPGGIAARAALSSKNERVYQWNPAIVGTIDGSPDHATKSAPMYFQVRRDIRIEFQISRLVYPSEGRIIDQPWDVPIAQTPRPFVCSPVATIPSGTSITPTITDAFTGSTTTVTRAFVLFTFASDTFNTPRLWSYKLRRSSVTATSSPGSFTARPRDVQLQDGGRDARRTSGAINLHDVFGQCPRLKRRGFLPCTIVTDFFPPGETTSVKVVLFRGYAVRPHWIKRGRVRGAGRGFPDWYQYDVPLSGMWYRLTKPPIRGMINWRDFASDPAAPDSVTPYKVTDAVKVLLDLAGFPAGQINIPDNPTRLFPGIGTEPSDLLYDGSTSIAEMISRLLENYLGAALYYDENAGADDSESVPVGQWTILFPPKGDPASGYPDDAPPPPVLNFVRTSPTQPETGYKVPGLIASYPANTVPCFGPAEGTNEAPEGNHLWVITAPDVFKTGGVKLSNHAYNGKSYQVPGWSAAPDPESPHYTGMEWPILVADPTLWGGDDLTDTQKAVDFITRRLFNYACLARELESVHGPLVFVQDATTLKWRKPRYYDPVTLDGEAGWYIKSVAISYRRDHSQMATYELERTVPL